MEISIHIAANMGDNDNAVRSIVGLLHPVDRAADVHGPDPALRRAAQRIFIGSALSHRLDHGSNNFGLRRLTVGTAHLIPADVLQALEHGRLGRSKSELHRCHLGRMRPLDCDAHAFRHGFSLRRHLRRQSDESYRARTKVRRHPLRPHKRGC